MPSRLLQLKFGYPVPSLTPPNGLNRVIADPLPNPGVDRQTEYPGRMGGSGSRISPCVPQNLVRWRRHRHGPVYAGRYHPIRFRHVLPRVLPRRRIRAYLGRLRGPSWLANIDKVDVTVSAPGIEPSLIRKCSGNQEEDGAEGCSSGIVSRRDGNRRSDRGYFCDIFASPGFADLKGGKALKRVGVLQCIVKSNLGGLVVCLPDSQGKNNLAHCQDLVRSQTASSEDRCRCGQSSAGDLLGSN